ncbi:hypothetical protein D3C79_614560 [compost metagenome]
MQGALQVVADRQRQVLISLAQKGFEAVQVPQGLVAEYLQQLRVDGFVGLGLAVRIVHGQCVQVRGQLFDLGMGRRQGLGELTEQCW